MIKYSPHSMLVTLDRLYDQNPAAMERWIDWVRATEYGTVTLVFRDGKLAVVEHTETAK